MSSSTRRCRRVFAVAASLSALCSFAPLAHAQAPGAQSVPFATGWEEGAPVTIPGRLSVIQIDDFDNRQANLVHTLRDERTGQSFTLRFEGQAPADLRSGAAVRVSGHLRESEIFLLADGSGQIQQIQSALSPASDSTLVAGDQNTNRDRRQLPQLDGQLFHRGDQRPDVHR